MSKMIKTLIVLLLLLSVSYLATDRAQGYKKVTIHVIPNLLTSEITSHKEDEINPDLAKLCEVDRDAHSLISSNQLHTCVEQLPENQRKHILVTGGSGFVGSHLVDNLMLEGHKVTVIDNLSTGSMINIDHWLRHKNFTFIREDVANLTLILRDKIDQIYHLASPASPKYYSQHSIETIQANVLGTMNMLELASKNRARVVLASTSEIYGSPMVHPQSESYWGNVNPVGPRSSYDESKRLAEAMAAAYRNQRNVSIGIARIFNTYGPRMRANDGRVVSNFIVQALTNGSMTVYGDGTQTRSFQYISDLVDGLKKLMTSNVMTPVNLGNPDERTIISLANYIREIFADSSTSDVVHGISMTDDPPRRRPDIELARQAIGWQPKVNLSMGLTKTIDYFKRVV